MTVRDHGHVLDAGELSQVLEEAGASFLDLVLLGGVVERGRCVDVAPVSEGDAEAGQVGVQAEAEGAGEVLLPLAFLAGFHARVVGVAGSDVQGERA